MLQDERHEMILQQLHLKHAVKVASLAKELNISESTIRRDITELHQQGKLKKVFGGAVSITRDIVQEETDVAARSSINVALKEQIARYAAAMIEDEDFAFIDAGTTTERMIDYLENRKATYVTNGLTHGLKLIRRGFDAYIVGGLLRLSTEAAIGARAVESISQYNFTKCFIGTNGVDLERGYTTPDIGEAAVKTAVINQSGAAFILADHTKFGRVSSITFADLEDACIITDKQNQPEYGQHTVVRETV